MAPQIHLYQAEEGFPKAESTSQEASRGIWIQPWHIHVMCPEGVLHADTNPWDNLQLDQQAAALRDNVAKKEVHEVTGGAILSYSGLVNMDEAINVPLLEENALGHVLRQKGIHITCSLLYAQISVELLL